MQSCRSNQIRISIATVILWAIVLCAASLLCEFGVAQENPFGGSSPFGEEPAKVSGGVGGAVPAASSGEVAGTFQKDPDPVVQSLRDMPPKTPSQFALALQQLSRLRRWDEVGRLLDQLDATGMASSQSSALVREIGTAGWFAIRSKAVGLSPAHVAVLDRLLDSASSAARNEQVLATYFKSLRAESIADQKRALLGIQSAGNDGLAYFLSSVIADDQVPNRAMLATLQGFGSQGVLALKSALSTSDTARHERLLALTIANPGGAFLPEISSLSVSNESTNSTRLLASDILQRMGVNQPTPGSVLKDLAKRLDNQLVQYNRSLSRTVEQQVDAWRLVGDDERIENILAAQSVVELERCAQLATCIVRVATASDMVSAVAVATLLEQRYRAEPLIFVDNPLGHLHRALPEPMLESAEFLCLVWDAAVQRSLPGAQLRIVQELQHFGPERLTEPTPVLDRLVAAVRSQYPAVRYAAGQTSIPWVQTRPFGGSHRVGETLTEMSRLEARPLTLVIGGNAELRNHACQLVEQLGGRCAQASNARDGFRFVEQPQPIERVLVVHHVFEMDLGQLVERLRFHHRAKGIPIAVLASDLSPGEHARLADQANLEIGSLPPTVEGMANIMGRLDLIGGRLEFTASERILWQSVAADFLRDIAQLPHDQRPVSYR